MYLYLYKCLSLYIYVYICIYIYTFTIYLSIYIYEKGKIKEYQTTNYTNAYTFPMPYKYITHMSLQCFTFLDHKKILHALHCFIAIYIYKYIYIYVCI